MVEVQLFDNKYEFVKDLGKGGFGQVFLAKEKISNRLVAIKQLNNQDKTEQDKIIHEIQVVAKFNHPNIVSYLHHFFQDELLFLVMEYCARGSLRDVIANKKIDSVNILRWITELSETLQVVHERRIVHHDIKPDNILFTENWTIKLSDFGIANTGAGTRGYMSPEALSWDRESVTDPRVDIYALGVTLMELLCDRNPFFGQSIEGIIALHDKNDFPIRNLSNWEQEIILKSINKVPELRFQSMKDFAEAIHAKQVPFILNKDGIIAGGLAKKVDRLLSTKKWMRAGTLLEFAVNRYPNDVNILHALGKFHLLHQRIEKAGANYETALTLNPRLDVQKDLGWINLAKKNYPTAISLLSDHLHRNPTDFEAYNLLLQCFYETERYEAGIGLARTLLDIDDTNPCFQNNYYVCSVMHHIGQTILPDTVLKVKNNDFVDYNLSVVLEAEPSHSKEKKPTLKSKLLFMDYRFHKSAAGKLYFTEANIPNGKIGDTEKRIITFGRESYGGNDVPIPGGSAISRRHCLIVNCKDDVWLYDLGSTGTYVNKEKVINKVPLIDLNTIRIDKVEYKVTTDRSKLF